MNESENVFWGLQQLLFTIRFYGLCVNNQIESSLFRPELAVTFDEDKINIPEWDAMNHTELIKGAGNQLVAAMGACVIAVDDALSARHGASSFKNWKNNPTDLNALREVIFLLRSAYAHKIPDVHWHIAGPRNSAKYVVNTPDGRVEFDASNKHKKKLELAHFGGMKGFLYLINFALDILAQNKR